MAAPHFYEIENRIALEMLKEASHNQTIQQALREVGRNLYKIVLNPLQKSIHQVNNFSELPTFIQQSIINLARHHSQTELQYGSVLANYNNPHHIKYEYKNFKTIINKKKNIQYLLATLKKTLAVKNLKNIHDIAKVMKTIVDLGYCYREFFPVQEKEIRLIKNKEEKEKQKIKWHEINRHPLFQNKSGKTLLTSMTKKSKYTLIDSVLWPTPSEFLIRLSYAELGQGEYVQTEFGIGKTPHRGLISKITLKKKESGKRGTGSAMWAKVRIKKCIIKRVAEFDQTTKAIKNQTKKLHKTKKEIPEKINEMKKIEKTITKLKKKYGEMEKDLCYFNIPLDQKKRIHLSPFVKRWKFLLEKLGPALPRVASISGSTARLLITLQNMQAFKKNNGAFDFNKAQILVNCIMGFFIHAGHHSFAEVAEIYNRLIDYVTIYHPEQLPKKLRGFKNKGQYREDFNVRISHKLEEKLPYYCVGIGTENYKSFLHPSYADNIIAKTRKLFSSPYTRRE